MSWWVPVLAFVGAVLGTVIPAFVSRRGQNQAARTEWRQRLDHAIDFFVDDNPAKCRVGAVMLTDLVDSDLGTAADHQLAWKVGGVRLDIEDSHAPARPGRAERPLDPGKVVRDTGEEQGG